MMSKSSFSSTTKLLSMNDLHLYQINVSENVNGIFPLADLSLNVEKKLFSNFVCSSIQQFH